MTRPIMVWFHCVDVLLNIWKNHALLKSLNLVHGTDFIRQFHEFFWSILLRWLLPWKAGLSERVSLQTSSHHHDYPQRTISDKHTALPLHQWLPPGHLEPSLVRINHTNRTTQLYGRHNFIIRRYETDSEIESFNNNPFIREFEWS